MDVSAYLQSKSDIPWNGMGMANHLVMSEEFLDSLLPIYKLLEPGLKVGILFSLLQLKKKDITGKIRKVSS